MFDYRVFFCSLMTFSVMTCTAGCDRGDSVVCESSKIQESLKSDFSYELQHYNELPQVIFKNFSLKNRMNSLVWCSCQSELSGNGRDVVRSLITKFGEKNWRQSRKLFKNSDYSKWSNRKISKYKSQLALYLLDKYQDSFRDKSYIMKIDVNYNIDITGNVIRNVDYQEDINVRFLSLVAVDIPLDNVRDQFILTKILNSQSVK
ncbi:MAG: hypothetical protein II847_09135 [Ruminobacter sp.]|nr:MULTISPECIES: hypothetical protein [Ruminobacter]MBQ3776267.1 hypothetical protein [Ruminobacter sp.]